MLRKGEIRFDEFAWVILIAVAFVLITTIILNIGIGSPVLDPRSSSLILGKGDSQYVTLTLRSSDGGTMKNVNITSFGEIGDWIKFDSVNVDVVNSTPFRIRIDVPKTASLKTYVGGIKASSEGGSSIATFSITVGNASQMKLNSRPIFLGDIEVLYEKGTETLASKSDLSISKGLFSQTKKSFAVDIPAEKLKLTTSAYIELTVVESNKKGNLVVDLNGKEIYNKAADLGKIIIPIEKSELNLTNVVNIMTTGPSPILFWTRASYQIESANFAIKFEDTAERQRAFTLTPQEMSNFNHFVLQDIVRDYRGPLQTMFVKINNQIVYASVPPVILMNQTITKDILGNNLFLGQNNTISFSFEKESFIDLTNVFLVVYSS